MKIEVNIKKRYFYILSVLLILLIGSFGVWAYGTSNPSNFGHTWDELANKPSNLEIGCNFNGNKIIEKYNDADYCASKPDCGAYKTAACQKYKRANCLKIKCTNDKISDINIHDNCGEKCCVDYGCFNLPSGDYDPDPYSGMSGIGM